MDDTSTPSTPSTITTPSGFEVRHRVFEARRYAPDGGFRMDGVLTLLAVLALGGAVLGVVAHFLGKLLYLIVLYPAAIGGVLGTLGQRFVTRGHLRNPWLGGAAGLLGGIFAMAVMHYASYIEFKRELAASLPAELQALDAAALEDVATVVAGNEKVAPAERAEAEDGLKAIRAMHSFPRFMNLVAGQGVEISNHGGKGINLGYTGSWIYWGLEVLLVAGLCLWRTRETAREPYCVSCQRWKEWALIAYLDSSARKAKEAVESGDTAKLAATSPDAERATSLSLHRALCPGCQGISSTVDLKVVEVVQKRNDTTNKTVTETSWPGESLPVLEAVCRAPTAAS